MFKKPFSFSGRIRRTEYALSFVIYIGVIFAAALINEVTQSTAAMVVMIPLVWFLWAQGAKRCHDINSTGWMQLVPFYGLWMLFSSGDNGTNKYGPSPKAVVKQQSEFTLDEI